MYTFGSAGQGEADAANRIEFEKWKIIPRMLRDATHRNLNVGGLLEYCLAEETALTCCNWMMVDHSVRCRVPLALARLPRRRTGYRASRRRDCDSKRR